MKKMTFALLTRCQRLDGGLHVVCEVRDVIQLLTNDFYRPHARRRKASPTRRNVLIEYCIWRVRSTPVLANHTFSINPRMFEAWDRIQKQQSHFKWPKKWLWANSRFCRFTKFINWILIGIPTPKCIPFHCPVLFCDHDLDSWNCWEYCTSHSRSHLQAINHFEEQIVIQGDDKYTKHMSAGTSQEDADGYKNSNGQNHPVGSLWICKSIAKQERMLPINCRIPL